MEDQSHLESASAAWRRLVGSLLPGFILALPFIADTSMADEPVWEKIN